MSRPVHAYAPPAFMERFATAFAAEDPDRELVAWTDPSDFASGIDEVEFILVLQPPRGHWGGAARLRLVQCVGAGVDDVLPAPDLDLEVPVANMAGMSAPAMSEHAVMLLMALFRGLHRTVARQHAHTWERFAPDTVAGKTLGILGLGNVGRAVAAKAGGLGMRVIGTEVTRDAIPHVDEVMLPEETSAVLEQADAVVVLLPFTRHTSGLLDRAMLARMRRGSYLVGLSRGGIIDEGALTEMLSDGRLGGAALDVFAVEPLPADDPLWDVPNLFITPHVAGGFPGFAAVAATRYVENIDNVQTGRPVRSQVDRAATG